MRDSKFYTHNAKVDSTALVEYWYDKETGDFFVEFPSGQRAGYKNVPQTTFDTFLAASSKGQFYATQIKLRFHGQSSEVVLHPRKVSVPEVNPAIGVGVYEVTFTAEMTAKFSASSVEEAVSLLKRQAEQADVRDLKVRSVTFNFE